MSDGTAEAELGYTPLKVTLKGGPGFEEPWLVIDAETTGELVAQLAAVQADGVMEAIVAASQRFRQASHAKPAAGAAPPKASKQSSPSSSASAPAADENVTAETDPIKAEIDAAETEADLRKVYPKFKGKGWTDEHTKYASSRAAALKEKQ